MKITVLGSGRWASFLAWYFQERHDVLIWGRQGSESWLRLKNTLYNNYITLLPEVNFTNDLSEAMEWGELVMVAISAQKLRPLCEKIGSADGKTLVLCMKGLEQETGLRLTQVVRQVLGNNPRVAVWVGPGHPQDFVKGIPNCMVIDSESHELTKFLADSLRSRLIRFYYGADLIGTEVGAAAKNVIGIAAGMLDGLGHSSLKGVLMARGAREISRLVGALGGEEITVYGISHLGDYEATLFSPYSHNRKFGESFVTGMPYSELAEGVATARSLLRLAEQTHVELPISRAVVNLLDGKVEAKDALAGLFLRDIKPEF